MLNTLYLRTFLAVIDTGNYTAAAEHLHMSQPAVSQHIRALEEQLGDVRLFRRVGQRMVPTHAGEELLAAARDLMVLAERTEQNIRSLRGQVSGRVIIGCTPSSGVYLLPPLLAVFRQRYPAVEVAVQVAPGDILFNALAAQQVTLLLIEESQRRRGWESYLLGQENLVLLAPVGHELQQQEQVAPGLLREQALLLPGSSAPLRRTIEEGLRRRGVAAGDLQIALECDSIVLLVQSVREGLGLAFIPQICLPMYNDLDSVRLTGAPLHQEWYILRIRERSVPRAAQEIHAFLTSETARTILSHHGISVPETA
jgi:DNA-binding transcriptional LysR family regulator